MKWKKLLLLARREKRVFDFKKLPAFLRLIRPYAIRALADDVLGLEPVNLIPVPVELLGAQERTYNELERDMMTTVDGEVITAPLKVTQISKLQQVCGGHLIDEAGEPHVVGRAKLRAVKGLLKTIGPTPIGIFCKYTEEVNMLLRELSPLRPRVERLTGAVKKKARPALIEAFQRGEIDVLICQAKTGGVGIDLFRSNNAILYSLSHSFIDFDQIRTRFQRRGQEKVVNLFLVYAINTVDEDVFSAIWEKSRISAKVLTGLVRQRVTRRNRTNGTR